MQHLELLDVSIKAGSNRSMLLELLGRLQALQHLELMEAVCDGHPPLQQTEPW